MKIVISSIQRSKNIPDIEELLAKVRALTNEGVDPEKSKSITELIKISLQLSVLKILGIDIPEGSIEVELADDVVADEQAEQIDELLTVYMVDNYDLYLEYTAGELSDFLDFMINHRGNKLFTLLYRRLEIKNYVELSRVTWNEDPVPDNEAAGLKK